MKFNSEINDDSGESNISPQLPSFVDVVFILLIFFLVLSVLGFGVVDTGEYQEGVFEKEQDVSDFPAVPKAVHKEIKEFLTLSLGFDEVGQPVYHIFSNIPFNEVTIQNAEEYQTIRSKILNNQFDFNGQLNERPLTTLESAWGPFSSAENMARSRLRLNVSNTNLILQASEQFTFHQIYEIMQLFNNFKSVYFEVIENEINS